MLHNTKKNYGLISKLFHWIVALAIFSLLFVGHLMGFIPEQTIKQSVYGVHKVMGMVVLLVLLARMGWRLTQIMPEIVPMQIFERKVAYLVHSLLYLSVLIMPLSGWIMSTAAGYPPRFAGFLIAFPFIVKDEFIKTIASNIHMINSWCLLTLIIMHVAAALWHQWAKKDKLITKMWF